MSKLDKLYRALKIAEIDTPEISEELSEIAMVLDLYEKASSVCIVRRESVICEITDFDIATIEALHDLLLDTHNYNLNHPTLVNARKLTDKMYKAFKSDKNKRF